MGAWASKTAIEKACINGDLDEVKRLICQDPALIFTHDPTNGSSLLQLAAHSGHYDIAHYLLNVGMDVDEQQKDGQTSLFMAVAKRNRRMLWLLLEWGADARLARHEDKWTPLMLASSRNDINTVHLLLDRDGGVGHVDARDTQGKTALFIATEYHHLPVIGLLLHANAEPSIPDGSGLTPLIIATSNNDLKIVRQLLKCDSRSIHVNFRQGKTTALAVAAKKGHTKIVMELLIHGE